MRVLIANADVGGCGFYRLIAPADALRNEPDLDIVVDRGAQTIQVTHDHHNRVLGVDPLDFDVVVFQRPLDGVIADVIPHLRAQGVAVVIEFDDDFWRIDRRNIAWEPLHTPPRGVQHLERACAAADLVTVSTNSLQHQVRSHVSTPCRLLRNYVPEDYLTIEPDPPGNWEEIAERVLVGWTGTPGTHPGDLEVAGTGVVRAVRESGALFFTIGSQLTGHLLGFDPGESAYTEWVVLDRYPSKIACFDIGIVPLKRSQFNEGKSWLKGLEFASLGVPFVTSQTEPYMELSLLLGERFIARTPGDWYRMLRALIKSESMRADIAGRNRQVVAADLTYEHNAERWVSAWQQAIKNHHKRKVAA